MSNWQLSGIFTFTSGSPLSINSTCVGGRANVGSTPYLNKAAFVDPANYTASNIARSAPLGVRREFHLIERVRLSFQADAFNLTNAVNFAAPATNIDTATFGIFSAMSNQPRKLQLGARVSF